MYLLDGPLLVIGYRNYFEIRSFRNSDEFCKPFKFYYQDIITNSNGSANLVIENSKINLFSLGNDQQSFTVEEISGLVRGCCRSDFDKWFYILSIEIRIANSFSSNATATCYTFHYSFNSAAFLDRLTSQPIDALTNASPLIRNSTSFPISAVTYLKASEEIRGFPWISEAVRGVYNNCYTTQSGISGGGISGSGGKCRGILDEALDSKVLQIYAIQNHDKGVVVDTTIRVGYLANSEYFHFLYPIGVTNVNVYSRILPVTSPITKMYVCLLK